MDAFYHEGLARDGEAMRRLREATVTVCGAGALGANIAESLARTGVGTLRVIDFDRIEERNLSTQPWQRADIGAHKARILANALYRSVGTKVDPITQRLEQGNAAKLLREGGLVIDAFDNSVSRRAVSEHCTQAGMPCLHAGLADGYAEILWNENYRVPSAAGDDVCDYPLTRNLALMASSIAAEVAVRFLTTGARGGYTLTFEDLVIRPWAG